MAMIGLELEYQKKVVEERCIFQDWDLLDDF